MTNEHDIGETDDLDPPPPDSPSGDLKARLYRGEHLSIVQEYLEGRLLYEQNDWQTAGLVSLAMRHHFAALGREGRLSVDFTAEQVDDGLAITVRWPEDRAIDAVDISLELTDAVGTRTDISRRFARESDTNLAAGRLIGRGLASNQTVVLRPLRSAVQIRATAQPSHRLRFDEGILAPQLRFCVPEQDFVASLDFRFGAADVAEMTRVDVYREAQGREVLELVTLQEQRERAQRVRARRRRKRVWRTLKIIAGALAVILVLVIGLVFVHRFVTPLPGWVPFVADQVLSGSSPGVSRALGPGAFQEHLLRLDQEGF